MEAEERPVVTAGASAGHAVEERAHPWGQKGVGTEGCGDTATLTQWLSELG